MINQIYQQILNARAKQEKQFAVLIDPDKFSMEYLDVVVGNAFLAKVDYFLVGGSLIMKNTLDKLIKAIKERCDIPIILFPGSTLQITDTADALLFLSLISGRNPEMLIGQHVTIAPILKKMELEVISTGYLLVDGGKATTASYISNSAPIPHDKANIAACTAMAGEMLGMKLIYMDTGSGAQQSVSKEMVKKVRENIELPIIVGGGIRKPETARQLCEAGADLIVVGTAIEKDPTVLIEIAQTIHSPVFKS